MSDDINTVAVFINSTRSFYNALMTEKLAFYLSKNNTMIFSFFLYDKQIEKEDIEKCLKTGIRKFVSFLEPRKDIIDYIDKLENVELFVIGRKIVSKNVRCVYTDDMQGGALAANYLFSNNCKKYIYIGFDDNECSKRRFEGFKNQLTSLNVSNIESYKVNDINREFIDKCIKNNTGIFFFNDELLLNFKRFFESCGIMKRHISIVGYDGINSYYNFIDPYHSVYFDYDEIASCLADMVVHKLSAKEVVFDVTLNRV